MKINYCLPIIKDSKKEVLKFIRIKGFNFYEVWLDYIKDLDEKFMITLAKKFKGKIIFVFRRKNLEPIKLSIDKRRDLISLLSKLDVFLDLDFLTQHEELEFLRKNNAKAKLVLSYHNYKETPNLDHLENLINKMKRYHPNIFKVSTFCQGEEDSLNLLNLLLKLRERRLKYIVLGMGELGVITRIFGSIWGNEMSFTPQDLKERSAEGQIAKKQLQLILRGID